MHGSMEREDAHSVPLNKHDLITSSSNRNVGYGFNPPATHDERKGYPSMRETTLPTKLHNVAQEVMGEVINPRRLMLVGGVM
jgi:hypothetical protein